MVRPYSAIVAVLAISLTSSAQSAGIGLKGGIQASIAKALFVRTSPIPGGTAGIYFPWGVGPMVELQPEVLISTLGSGWVEPDGDTYIERSVYIQVPLTVKRYFSNGFHLALGYQFGRPVAAFVNGSEGNGSVLERYNNLDMGVVGGLGMDFEHGLDLGVRAFNAVSRSYRDDDVLFAKNRSIQITAGYRIHQFGRIPGRRR